MLLDLFSKEATCCRSDGSVEAGCFYDQLRLDKRNIAGAVEEVFHDLDLGKPGRGKDGSGLIGQFRIDFH